MSNAGGAGETDRRDQRVEGKREGHIGQQG
jgi:hypothetical protein